MEPPVGLARSFAGAGGGPRFKRVPTRKDVASAAAAFQRMTVGREAPPPPIYIHPLSAAMRDRGRLLQS